MSEREKREVEHVHRDEPEREGDEPEPTDAAKEDAKTEPEKRMGLHSGDFRMR